jgi:hypothetical protein
MRIEMFSKYISKRICACLGLTLALSATAQVSVDVKIDSVSRMIGEQAHITLQVTCPQNARVQLPVLRDTLTAGVELLEQSKPDTVDNDDIRKIAQVYTITSFDSAVYYIPPFVVKVNDKEYASNSLALKVMTCEVDTTRTDQFFGPKEIADLPFSWDDWESTIYAGIAILILLLSGGYFYYGYRHNKPILRRIRREKKLSPHAQAMQEIERIKEDKIAAGENSKEYYTRLTDTLRTYIKERYGFNAMEMTSTEIIEHLQAGQDEEALRELRVLFRTADLVKFARYTTLMNENDMNLLNAVDFINHTKQEDVAPEKPEPEVEIVVDPKTQRTRRIQLISILVASIIILALLGYIGWRIYEVCY